MFTFIKFLIKIICKITARCIGFITAMALGPGMLLMLYLYEPHRPLPDMISGLPVDHVEAAQVMQGRVDRLLQQDASIPDVEAYLNEAGFLVDSAANNAVYKRRQFECIESYVIVWTENRERLDKAAALFEMRCPGIAKS